MGLQVPSSTPTLARKDPGWQLHSRLRKKSAQLTVKGQTRQIEGIGGRGPPVGEHNCIIWFYWTLDNNCCCCSVTQSCLTLCNPMDCGTTGFPVLHHLPELAQTHVHWVSDAIQPPYPLLSPSPPPFNLSQHQGLFQWVGSFPSGGQSIGTSVSASVLPVNIQDWLSLGLTGLISLLSKGLSRVFSNITVQKHQFFGAKASLWSNSHIHTWLLENHSFDYTDLWYNIGRHLTDLMKQEQTILYSS